MNYPSIASLIIENPSFTTVVIWDVQSLIGGSGSITGIPCEKAVQISAKSRMNFMDI
jgi:hypothetical protein